MGNIAKKDHILDLSLFQVKFDEEQYISGYLAAYAYRARLVASGRQGFFNG